MYRFYGLSLCEETVTLEFVILEAGFDFSDTANFLGISIVGQSNKAGDGGIYVGSIMKGLVSSVISASPGRFNNFKNNFLHICSLEFCVAWYLRVTGMVSVL